MGLFGALSNSTRVAGVTVSSNRGKSSRQAPVASGTSATGLTVAPRIAGCAVRLGHTGTTTTTSSPAPASICIAIISAVTPDEVIAMRSAPSGRCSRLV